MFFKFLFLNFIIFNSLLFSSNILKDLNIEERNLLYRTYHIGKNILATNGFSFNKTLCAILLTETSSGKFIIGDSFNKDKKRRHLLFNSLGPFQVRLSTAKFMSWKIPSLYFLKNKSDYYIMNKLLNDYSFSAIMAAQYLKYNYEKNNFDYFQSISRYNGGNKNIVYYNKVLKNLEKVEDLEDIGFFN